MQRGSFFRSITEGSVCHSIERTDRGTKRESAVVPREDAANVIDIAQPTTGESAQHPVAHLLGDGGNIPGCQRLRAKIFALANALVTESYDGTFMAFPGRVRVRERA